MEEEEKELQEKDFIHEEYSKDPMSLWIWLGVFCGIVVLIWGGSSWYYRERGSLVAAKPFLQVTNRELSTFLWQFPQLMRQHVKNRTGYLTDFEYIDHIGIAEGAAEKYVVAPPELLFLYHTWDRLIKREFSPRAIPRVEFMEFLAYMSEWKPENWPAAPEDYKHFIATLSDQKLKNLAIATNEELPMAVRMAFQGWKNYFLEGNKINRTKPTFSQMEVFLKSHPHYSRNYWRNVVEEDYPQYLAGVGEGSAAQEEMPSNQIAPFLRLAFYNSISD